jgi:hypothetical protein
VAVQGRGTPDNWGSCCLGQPVNTNNNTSELSFSKKTAFFYCAMSFLVKLVFTPFISGLRASSIHEIKKLRAISIGITLEKKNAQLGESN